MTDATPAEETPKAPVDWTALRGGQLGLHEEGHTELRSAIGLVLSQADRDKAIAADRTLAHAWLLQAADRRNENDDPIPTLLQADTADLVVARIRERLPDAFADAPPNPKADSATVPYQPIRPILPLFAGDAFAKLTRDRLAHHTWLESWQASGNRVRHQRHAIDSYWEFIRRTALTVPGGTSRLIAKIVNDLHRQAVRRDQVGTGTIRCTWPRDAPKAKLFHLTTTLPSLWTVTSQNNLPTGLRRRPLDLAEALPLLQRLHATALYLAMRIAFDVLPRHTTVEWLSSHQSKSGLPIEDLPRPVLTASVDKPTFDADEDVFLGTLSGGALPRLAWLQWAVPAEVA